VKTPTEIAEKYCHILEASGANSTVVKQAALVMATAVTDGERLRKLNAILRPATGLEERG